MPISIPYRLWQVATLNQVAYDIACYRAFAGTSFAPSYCLQSAFCIAIVLKSMYRPTNIKILNVKVINCRAERKPKIKI